MFDRELLRIVRPRPSEDSGLVSVPGGRSFRSASGEVFHARNGYLDLLGRKSGADNVANLTNYLPGAGRAYEPLWRVRSLSLLTGEKFTNEREVEVIAGLAGVGRGGLFLDLGCSAGLYTRNVAASLGGGGSVVGVDISPSMLSEAVRRAERIGVSPSFVRADAENLPFTDASFDGALCGGSLNEFGDPARALRETGRVLRAGGRLAVMGILRAKTKNGLRLQKFLSTGGVRFFEEDEAKSMISRAGFHTDSFQTFGSVFFAGATKR